MLPDRGNNNSKGNLEVPVKVGPAELSLQEEVDQILAEVGVHDVVNNQDENDPTPRQRQDTKIRFDSPNVYEYTCPQTAPAKLQRVKDFRGHSYQKKSAGYRDYKHLRDTEVPRPHLPQELRSRHLSREKCDQIWNWLHWDFKKSKFENFLDVCS